MEDQDGQHRDPTHPFETGLEGEAVVGSWFGRCGRGVRAWGHRLDTELAEARGGHRRRVPAPAGRHPCGSRLVVRLGVAVS